ncbi:hypothetical protein L227DRAFT_348563 [Lentinus tigrinus ALCF2SS1-6]|uniref:HNH nuclease domain-containing protein n=1 Tax=Lentinus tigrinus ALCF2SS1-6 TaxID=1328759 RepID=A0A5C2RT45_9APHY|nr:hypothetical protein L227DRAFT_348563 [Lentinus tigrinus ALCF2SS1-6]
MQVVALSGPTQRWPYRTKSQIPRTRPPPAPRPHSNPGEPRGAQTVHDIRNYVTLRADLYERWDANAFAFVPVDGRFIAYYITPVPELQAVDFHCAQLITPQRMDGYLLYVRFALSIFTLIALNRLSHHPQSSPLMHPPSALFRTSRTVSRPPILPETPEEAQPSARVCPSEAVGVDPSAVMDDITAAKRIIDWYSDVD